MATSKTETNNNVQERRLLILDMNKVLCHKIYGYNAQPKESGYEKIEVNGLFTVYVRPDVVSFLNRCFGIADIAFWTSTKQVNAEPILDHILTDAHKKETVFRWYRDRTRLHPLYGKDESIADFDTIKDLNDVWSNPIINKDRIYHNRNTIILDDEPKKTVLNDSRNVLNLNIPFDAYNENYDDKETDNLIETILQGFESLSS